MEEGLGRWNGGELQWLGVRVLVHIVELFKDFEQGGVEDINLITLVQGREYTSVPYSGPWMPFCYGESGPCPLSLRQNLPCHLMFLWRSLRGGCFCLMVVLA